MTYNEALQLFGLKKDYTEKELEKRYAILKYKKNNNIKLNRAYNILKKQLYINKKNIEIKKERIINKLKKYYLKDYVINDEELSYYFNYEYSLVLKTVNKINRASSMKEVKVLLEKFLEKIKLNNINLYNRYIDKYKNLININNRSIYETRIKIEQAIKIEEAYKITYNFISNNIKIRKSMVSIDKNLDYIISLYKNNKNYNLFYSEIIALKQKAKEDLLRNNNIIDIVIYEKFKSDIAHLLNSYNRENIEIQKINKLKTKISKYQIFNLNSDIEKLEQSVGTYKFDYLFEKINKIVNKICKEKLLKRLDINVLKEYIKNIYGYIIDEKNIKANINNKEELELIKLFSQLIEKIKKQELNLKQLEIINLLVSLNIKIDAYCLNNILYLEKNDNIFIRKTSKDTIIEPVKIVSINEDALMYSDESNEPKIEQTDLFMEKYISLYDFLEDIEYVGKTITFKIEEKNYILLYKNIDYSLLYDEKTCEYIIVNNYNIECYDYKISDYEKEINENIKDKNYIYLTYLNKLVLNNIEDIKEKKYK